MILEKLINQEKLMKLEKLRIKPLSPSKLPEIVVPFNPKSYSISKAVKFGSQTIKGLNAPLLSFSGGESRILKLNLFVDVTEPVNEVKVNDVRVFTNKFVELMQISREQPRPPVCKVYWGNASPQSIDFPFYGVLSDLSQDFNFFEIDGRPLRADLDLTFKEFIGWEEDKRKTDPEFTTRVVKRGDTLSSIAAEMYYNPALWRVIADANGLDDPRPLEIGMTLNIPKIR
ncbi:MAG TPA: LysM peptidoglycan-binding domain-containing protein [Blastocatellia bacterium]|nr:LysM peptidoglycan-binding domain-containing protein [Blastocatellia bacterium]